MDELGLIPSMTQTQPDTEPMMSRLAAMMSHSTDRSQDALQDGIAKLEDAYASEANKELKSNIREALDILRNGHGDEDSDSSTKKDEDDEE